MDPIELLHGHSYVLPALAGPLLRSPNDVRQPTLDSRGESGADFLEQRTQEQTVSHGLRTAARFFHSQVRARRVEAIGLGHTIGSTAKSKIGPIVFMLSICDGFLAMPALSH